MVALRLATYAFTKRPICGIVADVNTNKHQDREIARHFMVALKVALADKQLSSADAEAQAGLAASTMSLWLSGKRMPSALRLAEVSARLGIDPGKLMNDGLRRAKAAGLLDDVEVLPASE